MSAAEAMTPTRRLRRESVVVRDEKLLRAIERALVSLVYADRRSGFCDPEGMPKDIPALVTYRGPYTAWVPCARERGESGLGRRPTRNAPLLWLRHCRTHGHCALLVRRAIEGHDVPSDVRTTIAVALFVLTGIDFRPYLAEKKRNHGAWKIANTVVPAVVRYRWLCEAVVDPSIAEDAFERGPRELADMLRGEVAT